MSSKGAIYKYQNHGLPGFLISFARGLLIHRRRRFFMPSLGETPRWLTYDRLLLDCWLTWTILDCLGWFENKNDVKDLGCISVRDSCCFPEASERCWAHNLRPWGWGVSQSQVMEVRKLVAGLEFLDIWIYVWYTIHICVVYQIHPMNLCRKSRALNSPGKKRGCFYLVKFLTQETSNPG